MRARIPLGSSLLAVCCAALATAAPRAQTVHTVGPGGFPQIQPAIAAASPGDVIVVQAGTYVPFTLDKGLTLTAAPNAIVDVVEPLLLGTAGTTFQIPASQRAHVAGLRFRNPQQFFYWNFVRVLGGTIAFADCVFEGHASTVQFPGLLVQQSDVVLLRCIVLGGAVTNAPAGYGGGGNDALELQQATLAASGCLFLGGSLNWDFGGDAGNGVTAVASRLQLSHCTAMGGDSHPFNPSYPPGPGVLVRAGSSAWLSDCSVLGGHATGWPGAAGLVVAVSPAAQIARTLLAGGHGTPNGPPSIGAVVQAPLLGSSAGSLVRGTTWQLDCTAMPATPVLVLLSDRLVPAVDARAVQPVWAGPGAAAVAFGVTDPAGAVAFAFAVPNAPALLHAIVWLHAFAGTALPLQAAPPAGGAVR